MNKNVGSIDANIRIAIGAIFLLIGLFVEISTGLRIAAFAVVAITFATAYLNF